MLLTYLAVAIICMVGFDEGLLKRRRAANEERKNG
jgi:hypothetical protein